MHIILGPPWEQAPGLIIFVHKEAEARVKEDEETGDMEGKSGSMQVNKTLSALRSLGAAHGLNI